MERTKKREINGSDAQTSESIAKGASAYNVRKPGFLESINCLAKNVMPTDHIAIPKEARSNHRLSPIPG